MINSTSQLNWNEPTATNGSIHVNYFIGFNSNNVKLWYWILSVIHCRQLTRVILRSSAEFMLPDTIKGSSEAGCPKSALKLDDDGRLVAPKDDLVDLLKAILSNCCTVPMNNDLLWFNTWYMITVLILISLSRNTDPLSNFFWSNLLFLIFKKLYSWWYFWCFFKIWV